MNIPYNGGGTNFEYPFLMAAEMAEKYIEDSFIVFIFMTDGSAVFPVKGTTALKKLQSDHPKKFYYIGIENHQHLNKNELDPEMMKAISEKLNGWNLAAFDPTELERCFNSSVEVIRYR